MNNWCTIKYHISKSLHLWAPMPVFNWWHKKVWIFFFLSVPIEVLDDESRGWVSLSCAKKFCCYWWRRKIKPQANRSTPLTFLELGSQTLSGSQNLEEVFKLVALFRFLGQVPSCWCTTTLVTEDENHGLELGPVWSWMTERWLGHPKYLPFWAALGWVE